MNVWHMSGAGNDFMVIDGRTLPPDTDYAALARRLCAKTHADGFMAVGTSKIADFRLHFYNSDGSRGEMCGNGSRCICRFAYENGIAGERQTVETDAGIVTGERLAESRYRVRLTNPTTLKPGYLQGVDYTVVGVPHAVVELPKLAFSQADALRGRAEALRHDAAFPAGANVDFFCFLAPDRVRVLTYERGVENYTLACGTGCGSVAAALWAHGKLSGGRLVCENRGGELTVTVTERDGQIAALDLSGSAQIVGQYVME